MASRRVRGLMFAATTMFVLLACAPCSAWVIVGNVGEASVWGSSGEVFMPDIHTGHVRGRGVYLTAILKRPALGLGYELVVGLPMPTVAFTTSGDVSFDDLLVIVQTPVSPSPDPGFITVQGNYHAAANTTNIQRGLVSFFTLPDSYLHLVEIETLTATPIIGNADDTRWRHRWRTSCFKQHPVWIPQLAQKPAFGLAQLASFGLEFAQAS